MTAFAVIPARFGASRFPGKPLAKDTGKYLVQHVYERASACEAIDRVIVATDDVRIEEAVKSFGGEVCMTNPDHPTGTDRVGEVARLLGMHDDDLVVNVQGDEPEISPEALSALVRRVQQSDERCSIGTLAARFSEDAPCSGAGSPLDPNCVKVVIDATGHALYFSRSLIPFPRGTDGTINDASNWLLHLGVYAFRAEALRRVTEGKLPASELAATESLEQLGWLQAGFCISVVVCDHRCVGIDTPEDYAAFVARYRSRSEAVSVKGS